MSYQWTDEALDDLGSIAEGLSRFSKRQAQRMIARLIRAVETVGTYTELGRIVPEKDWPEMRELIVDRYRVIYMVSGSTAVILTIHPTAVPFESPSKN